jgi:hypothetical protein
MYVTTFKLTATASKGERLMSWRSNRREVKRASRQRNTQSAKRSSV